MFVDSFGSSLLIVLSFLLINFVFLLIMLLFLSPSSLLRASALASTSVLILITAPILIVSPLSSTILSPALIAASPASSAPAVADSHENGRAIDVAAVAVFTTNATASVVRLVGVNVHALFVDLVLADSAVKVVTATTLLLLS